MKNIKKMLVAGITAVAMLIGATVYVGEDMNCITGITATLPKPNSYEEYSVTYNTNYNLRGFNYRQLEANDWALYSAIKKNIKKEYNYLIACTYSGYDGDFIDYAHMYSFIYPCIDTDMCPGRMAETYRYYRSGTGPVLGGKLRPEDIDDTEDYVEHVPANINIPYVCRIREISLDTVNGNVKDIFNTYGSFAGLTQEWANDYEAKLEKAGIAPDPINGTDYNPITNTYSFGIPTEGCTAIYIKPVGYFVPENSVKEYLEKYPDIKNAAIAELVKNGLKVNDPFSNKLSDTAYEYAEWHYLMIGMYEGRDFGGIWKPNVR